MYNAPRFIVHGTIEELTLEPDPQGNDPCRFNPPRNTFKQTGTADLILGEGALETCTPASP